MNYLQAVNEIHATTKRPDKANLARRKINAAISFYSLDNEFRRDYAEQSVTLVATEYTQAIALSELTRFRKFHYIKLGGTKKFLTPIPDSELFKPCVNSSRYYIAGSSFYVSLPSLASTLDVGYFQYPAVLLEDTDTNWMLDIAPFMIIDWAIGEVFKDIGDEKSFATHRASSREQYLAFRRDQGIANS
jgi:hypothetical protein